MARDLELFGVQQLLPFGVGLYDFGKACGADARAVITKLHDGNRGTGIFVGGAYWRPDQGPADGPEKTVSADQTTQANDERAAIHIDTSALQNIRSARKGKVTGAKGRSVTELRMLRRAQFEAPVFVPG